MIAAENPRDTAQRPTMRIYPDPDMALVTRLLSDNDLPTEDLQGSHAVCFFACTSAVGEQAVAGMETCAQVGLLRSLVVQPNGRNKGMATALVKHVETHALACGINELYLLTNTAEAFFLRLGYRKLARTAAPQAIRETREFSGLCPDDAAFMGKTLPQDP